MSEQLLTAEEVAKLLAVPESWVRSATRNGAMPYVRLGRYVRYREADVRDWIDACSSKGRVVTLRKLKSGP